MKLEDQLCNCSHGLKSILLFFKLKSKKLRHFETSIIVFFKQQTFSEKRIMIFHLSFTRGTAVLFLGRIHTCFGVVYFLSFLVDSLTTYT